MQNTAETVLPPVDITEEDDLILEEEFTPEELAEIEAQKEAWEREEMARIDRELSEHRRHIRDAWLSSGMDIVDYAKTHGETPEEVEKIRVACGFKSETWDDARNVQRREAGKNKRVSIMAKSATKAAVNYIKDRQSETASKVAKADKKADKAPAPERLLPGAPITTDREVLEAWARDYCRELCEKFQSVKLQARLFGKPENPGGGSLNYQLSIMPQDDALLPTWANGAQLSFDKKVTG